MCTLALALGADPRWPVVVAANRDERLGRPSEGWALRDGPDGLRYAAPRDAEAGGTWIGVSNRGAVAALTNFHAPFAWYPDPRLRSRGELVPLALAARSLAAGRVALSALDPSAWNPFHLVLADATGGLLLWYDGERSALEPLDLGLHLVTETSPHGAGARGDLLRARWPLDPTPARLRELLSLHAPEHPAPTCIHREPFYGTRSSAVLRVAPALAHADLFTAEGHPCEAPFEDRAALLTALAATRSP